MRGWPRWGPHASRISAPRRRLASLMSPGGLAVTWLPGEGGPGDINAAGRLRSGRADPDEGPTLAKTHESRGAPGWIRTSDTFFRRALRLLAVWFFARIHRGNRDNRDRSRRSFRAGVCPFRAHAGRSSLPEQVPQPGRGASRDDVRLSVARSVDALRVGMSGRGAHAPVRLDVASRTDHGVRGDPVVSRPGAVHEVGVCRARQWTTALAALRLHAVRLVMTGGERRRPDSGAMRAGASGRQAVGTWERGGPHRRGCRQPGGRGPKARLESVGKVITGMPRWSVRALVWENLDTVEGGQ